VRLAHFQGDAGAPMTRQFADQLADHLHADVHATARGVDGEVEDVQLLLVQLVDHEADDLLALLGHRANAVALPQTAKEVLLRPGILEVLLFGLEHFRYVAADHPADVDAHLLFLCPVHTHSNSSPPLSARHAAHSVHERATASRWLPFRGMASS